MIPALLGSGQRAASVTWVWACIESLKKKPAWGRLGASRRRVPLNCALDSFFHDSRKLV